MDSITLTSGSIKKRDDGIITFSPAMHHDISKDDALEIIRTIECLSQGERFLLLIDHTIPHSLSFDAIQLFAKNRLAKAVALLFETSINARTIDFFKAIGSPIYPMARFKEISVALNWLTKH